MPTPNVPQDTHVGCDADGLTGTIIEVIDGGSIWLVLVNTGRRIVDQAIEPRYLLDILDGLGLSHPSDLIGRTIELSGDGMTVRFP